MCAENVFNKCQQYKKKIMLISTNIYMHLILIQNFEYSNVFIIKLFFYRNLHKPKIERANSNKNITHFPVQSFHSELPKIN